MLYGVVCGVLLYGAAIWLYGIYTYTLTLSFITFLSSSSPPSSCSDFNLRILLSSDGVRTILAALQDHDWDQDVVSTAVNLLHELMESNDTVPSRMFDLHGHRTLLCT